MAAEPSATRGPVATPSQLLVVGAIALGVTLLVFIRIPLLPSIGTDLHLSPESLGLFTAVFGAARLATDIPAGRIADRGRVLVVLGVSAALAGVGSFILAAASDEAWLFLCAITLGVASSTTNANSMTYVSRAVPFARRGAALGGLSTAMLLGQSAAPPASGFLAATVGWRETSALAGVFGILLVVFAVLSARRSPPAQPAVRKVREDPAGSRAGPTRVELLVLYAVAFATFLTISSVPQTLVPIMGARTFGLSSTGLGLVLGAAGLARLLLSLAGGVIADRVSRKAILVPGLLAMAVGAILVGMAGGLAWWTVGLILLYGGSISTNAGTTMLADRSPSASIGRHLGGYRFAGDLGLIVGPYPVTALYAHAGAPAALLPVAALLALVAVAGAFAIRERPRDPNSPVSAAADEIGASVI